VKETLKRFPEVAVDPKPQVGIAEFADSSINISYRYWVRTAVYYQISYAVNLAVFKALQAAKITIPYPQSEVRVLEPLKK
jgi:small conductance mechanosensitive channel